MCIRDSPIISGSIFSSIPSIPRNNERNRRRFRRRVTSPFVLYSYQTVYCVSTIYTRRKLRFILYNWRGKKWRKMLLPTQKEAFRRDQPPHASSHGINLVVSCTSSEARRLRSCTRTLPEMLSHQGTCRLCSWQNRCSNQKVLE